MTVPCLISAGRRSGSYQMARSALSAVLPRAAEQREQAVMILTAGRAAAKVNAHHRHLDVGRPAGQFELDIRVEDIEALLTAKLGTGRPDQVSDVAGPVIWHVPGHLRSPSTPSPRIASAARSLRRESCNVL